MSTAFGSRAREALQWLQGHGEDLGAGDRDLDIGVLHAAPGRIPARTLAELAARLEDVFCCTRVDLVAIAEADPFVAANIVRGERLYCRNEHEADEYELYVLRRAGDLAPFERARLQRIANSR